MSKEDFSDQILEDVFSDDEVDDEMITVSKEEYDMLYEIAMTNKQKYSSKVKEIKELKNIIEQLKHENSCLKHENATLKEMNSQSQSTIDQLQTMITDHNESITKLQNTITNLQKTISNANNKNSDVSLTPIPLSYFL